MLILNLTLTTGCVVVMLLIAGLALMDRRPSQSKMILILLAISLSGLMVASLPNELAMPKLVKAVADLISIPNVGLIWWFALSIFDDNFQIKRFAWAGMIAEISGPVLFWLSSIGAIGAVPIIIGYVTIAIALILVCNAIWVGIMSYRDDLIQPRRQIRIWIVGLVVFALAVVCLLYTSPSPRD